jgi:hypothetical protein
VLLNLNIIYTTPTGAKQQETKAQQQIIQYTMSNKIDSWFGDLDICDICHKPFCADACETTYSVPEDGYDRCGSPVAPGTIACIHCGMDWQPLSPLSDEDNQ